ncbi:UbiX family flavin prenyltransferase [Orrella sp. NBD-18]|uniref:Flavin prenyltransferase UbiX n=1 Tax=Sheuella amnicola TaxID=2707330 RepID=A0A6B2R1Q3_9BURK|nr:UbiX family flavin prenyltransferase [Sheuella amnicola]NDY84172.1 UbiX family flavin prenyltransferase [Sheuella amnicola]HBI83582.1 3-octaprenyl-4-hydroxybenzoate carboxy-lyase [Alcaligenaceae bacterium]
MSKRRLVIGVTGATGSLYAVRMMQTLRERATDVETHLIVSAAGVLNIKHELDLDRHDVYKMADHVHSIRDVGATLASGAFSTAGMVIVPCSMRTLAAVAMGLSDNLITRAADVTLKERRRLVMVVRETPFNLAHLRNMTSVTEMGGIVFPPLPAFYHRPKSIDEMVDHTVSRILEMVGIDVQGQRWEGMDSI